MKQGNLSKKIGLLALAAAMIATSFPVLSRNPHVSGASEPRWFATAEKLRFLNVDGGDGSMNTARLSLGNQNREWWIVGSQREGRVTLFAANRLQPEVNLNYYGAGFARKPLKKSETDDIFWLSNLMPAFELDLSSVLFASAAKAASSESASSGTITTYHSVMTLRLDGSDQTMGNVIYDNETGRIAAQKAADSSETVSLVVQGNDGTKDWYYSVRAGGKTVVTKEQIRKACGISRDIDFAKCKIWLETTDDGVAYAKMIETGGSSSPPDERR